MKLLLSQWMQELDAEAIRKIGIPSIVLMENASRGAADFFASQFSHPHYKNAIIIAGKGNNGGDGLAIGRILHQKGYHVQFILLSDPAKLNTDPRINYDIIKNLEFDLTVINPDSNSQTENHKPSSKTSKDSQPSLKGLKNTKNETPGYPTAPSGKCREILDRYDYRDTFIVDAIFGTGLNHPITDGYYFEIITLINETPFKVAAVDIPSGLSDAFLPKDGVHINADITATFQCLKTAHIHPDGNKYCGIIHIIDIGIPSQLIEKKDYYIRLIEPQSFSSIFKKREIDAHKGTYGHSLTICGSIDKPGAGILSSYAVLKAGAALCTAAVNFENRTIPVTVHPELMTLVYNEEGDILKRLKEFNAILMGPGLGNTDITAGLVSTMMVKSEVPLILDADAINILQTRRELLSAERKYPIIFTPHPGEFSRLTGRSMDEIKRNRIRLARTFAMEFDVYLILKGHHTIIATPQGNVYVNITGNPGMATAGSGDVLSGMITGFISQFTARKTDYSDHASYSILDEILQAAVFLHGYAGDLAVEEMGEICLTAGDIIRYIPRAIRGLSEFRNPFTISR